MIEIRGCALETFAFGNDYQTLSAATRARLGERTALFVDGQFQAPLAGRYRPIHDASNNREIAQVAQADAQDVDLAVAAARRAFEGGPWPKMRPHQREALMLKLAELIAENAQELAELETLSSGRLLRNTRAFDVDLSVYTLRYMAGWATKLTGKTLNISVPYLPDTTFSGFTRRFPVGVVAALTPWNVPLGQAVWKLAPVLATGCTIVLKPAEPTPLTALRLAQLCNEAGIPPGVVNVVTGDGEQAGAALVAHPRIDKVSFTGSSRTGRQIASILAPQLVPYTLELGGKSPVVVAQDADLDIAIEGAAWAIFGNHGQNCCAGSRLFIHKNLYETVVAGVAEVARSIRLGAGLNPASEMGPLVHVAHRDKVLKMVEKGIQAGGELVCGGRAVQAPGAYMEPTIITGLKHDDYIVQNEIFGPVLVAFPFSDDAEAIAQANATSFGLGASIWTRDINRSHRFFNGFQAGTVWINTHNVLDLALPFGGIKNSGVGHELGEEGLLAHTTLKAGVVRHDP